MLSEPIFINSSGIQPAAASPDQSSSSGMAMAMPSSFRPLRFDPALPRSAESSDEFMKIDSSDPKEPILSVQDLRTSLRMGGSLFEVIRGVDFNLYPGKTLALVGESGCGKSMTALSILRINSSPPVLPSKGKVMFRGKDLLTLSEKEMCGIRGGKIAMIFQDPSNALNPVYTIGEQLIESAMLHLNLNEEEAFNRSVKTLTEVGIAQGYLRMNDYPHQMSGGMKQRVMIAMALLCEPDILIADEPTTALDVTIQAQVLELMRDIQQRLNTAILLITHDMGVVAELAHDVAVMYGGNIVEQGSAREVFEAPAHPYTIGLFKSLKREGGKGHLYTIKGSVPSLDHIPAGCPFHPRCPYVFEKCYSGRVPAFEVDEEATFINSSQDLVERGEGRSKLRSLNEEGMVNAMPDEEDRSGEAATGRISDEFMKVASKPLHTARCWLHEK